MKTENMTVDVNRSIFEAYRKEIEELAEEIRVAMAHNDEDTFDGREWCDEHDIPESAFTDAVEWHYEWFDYGLSPMYPRRKEEYDE